MTVKEKYFSEMSDEELVKVFAEIRNELRDAPEDIKVIDIEKTKKFLDISKEFMKRVENKELKANIFFRLARKYEKNLTLS